MIIISYRLYSFMISWLEFKFITYAEIHKPHALVSRFTKCLTGSEGVKSASQVELKNRKLQVSELKIDRKITTSTGFLISPSSSIIRVS